MLVVEELRLQGVEELILYTPSYSCGIIKRELDYYSEYSEQATGCKTKEWGGC